MNSLIMSTLLIFMYIDWGVQQINCLKKLSVNECQNNKQWFSTKNKRLNEMEFIREKIFACNYLYKSSHLK